MVWWENLPDDLNEALYRDMREYDLKLEGLTRKQIEAIVDEEARDRPWADDETEAPFRPLIACIGPITAETARELGLRVDVEAAEHTVEGLVRAVAEAVRASWGGR